MTPRTISYSPYEKTMNFQNKLITIKIFDSPSGFYGLEAWSKFFMKNIQGLIVLYDVTYRESFDSAKSLALKLNREYPNIIITAFVGNKIDIFYSREISEEEGLIFAKSNNYLFYETSTKNQFNIKECFDGIIDYIINKYPKISGVNKLKYLNLDKYINY